MTKPKQNPKKKQPTTTTEAEPSFSAKTVRKFKEADGELTAFMKDPDVRDTLRQYHTLIQQRNEQLEGAIRAIKAELGRSERDKLFVEGIGAQKRHSYEYDIDHLRAYLPQEQIDLIITEEVVYKLNTEDLGRLVRQKEIDEEVVRQAYKEIPAGIASMPGNPKTYELPPLALEDEIE